MKKSPFNSLYSEIEKDFKAEVTAAELVDAGRDPERLMILMHGALKRSFSKDVSSVEEELSDYDHKEYLLVHTPKEGIYDMLPEGLFHVPSMHRNGKTLKEILKGMKQRKEEEQNARKFFLPFEATINYVRMQMALYENRLDKPSDNDELVAIFEKNWEIFRVLDSRQANIFLRLIPILHDMREDYPVIETVMEMILEVPVKVELLEQLPCNPADLILSRLGAASLGVDFTTGNFDFMEGVPEIVIQVGPVDKEMLSDLMPKGRRGKVLQQLSDYLLPVHLDTRYEFELANDDRITRLHDRTKSYNSILGVDTYL